MRKGQNQHLAELRQQVRQIQLDSLKIMQESVRSFFDKKAQDMAAQKPVTPVPVAGPIAPPAADGQAGQAQDVKGKYKAAIEAMRAAQKAVDNALQAADNSLQEADKALDNIQ
jgi:hypothetical protein